MNNQLHIDINCDMGESYGHFIMGNDAQIFPYITSCNIACGFHGGDPLHMEQTIQQALDHQVQIGAHPGYPDLAGFGRRKMNVTFQELKSLVKYQIAALKGLTESLGGQVAYVKPHGALYHAVAHDEVEAMALIRSIREIDPALKLMGPPDSIIAAIAKKEGVIFVKEAFADRRYEANGQLRAREYDDAVIHTPVEAAQQVVSLVKENKVRTIAGTELSVAADTVCVHGDNEQVVSILQAITHMLKENHIEKRHF